MEREKTFDYVVIGSGFGGSISAMRLTEKGYEVLVLERGKRFHDMEFARSDWNLWKHQWIPTMRCFGIRQNTLLNGIMILHGSCVGGGSLGLCKCADVAGREAVFGARLGPFG